MTVASALLTRARSLGVRVEPNGAKLRVIPPDGVPPDEWAGLVEGLAEFKAEVLGLLAASPSPAWIDDPSASVAVADVRAILDEYRRFYAPEAGQPRKV